MALFEDSLANRALRRLGENLGGKYRLDRLIGIGGMAAVYAGRHRNGHPVAVKVLHERLASDPEIERLFRREAQLANKVGHSGVVPVIDDDVSDDGCVFLVMPLLEGETLRARADRTGRKLPLRELIVVAREILDTLAAAHAQRIVHRDVKPENIFVTTGGDVRVLDFGIGRFFEANESASLTRSGRALGTPAFMAPEQALGRLREVDGRTDLWALGATMFSLLTGRFVHDAQSPTELAVLAATRPAPALGNVAPDVPRAVAAIIDRALMFKSEDRWQDATTMAQALGAAAFIALGEPVERLPRVIAPESAVTHRLGTNSAGATAVDGKSGFPARTDAEPNLASRDTLLLSRSTKTASGTAAAGHETRTIPPVSRNAHRWWWLLPFAVATAIAGAFSSRTREVARTGASSSPSSNEPAAARYRAGLDSWHDQRPSDDDFRKALELDPKLAAAHLALGVMPRFPTPDAHTHFAEAVKERSALSQQDLALLDAFEPAMRVPDDLEEAKRRLEVQFVRFRGDFRFAHALGSVLMQLGDGESMLRVGQEAIQADPTSGASWSIQALGYDLLGDVAKSRASFESCISHSRLAVNCMFMLASLEANEGRCDRVEELAQDLLAIGDRSEDTFGHLANGVYGRSRDPVMLDNVLKRAWRTAEPAISELSKSEQSVAQAILAGDFERAIVASRELEAVAASRDSLLERMPAAEYTIEIAKELGHPDEAAARATAFAAEMPALDSHFQEDVTLVLEDALLRGGAIDEAKFRRERDAWVSHQAPKFARRYGAFTFVWLYAYAYPARTRADAVEALAHMDEYLPMTDPLNRLTYRDEAIGRVYLLAERPQDAAPFLGKAMKSCTAMVRPFEHTRAALEFALAEAALGANAEACATAAQVVETWGREPRSVTAQKARELLSRIHCTTIR